MVDHLLGEKVNLNFLYLSLSTEPLDPLLSTQGSLTTGKVRVTVLDILVHPMTGIAVNGGNTSASCSAPSPASFVWLVAICVLFGVVGVVDI